MEDELRKRFPKYKKSRYDAALLVKNIDQALLNEEHFCQDINGLKTNVGSNIGILIKEMREPLNTLSDIAGSSGS